jgi:DNA-binding CsgD family transcriptional regulator
VVLFTLERSLDMDPFDSHDLAQLDAIRPHLARASLMAARLQMQQAEATVAALTALGLPAAVLSGNGVVLAVNALFESDAAFLKPAAFGRLVVATLEAHALLQAMLPGQQSSPEIRSLPVRPQEPDGPAAVIHVIPLERAAQDIFSSGSALVVVTNLSREGMVPDDGLLRGLFDLSAAEAKLATGLAGGRSLQDIATTRSISMATARSQLAQIFRKTGTGQQSELVALLKSAPTVTPPDARKRDPASD